MLAAGSVFADGAEPPANDNMADAMAISGESGSVEGTCDGATQDEDNDSVYNAWEIENSVWYRWTAPATGNFKFDTEGSEADTVMVICTAVGKVLASNDDINEGNDNLASRAVLQAKAGTEYLIGVGSYTQGIDCEEYYDEEYGYYKGCAEYVTPPFVLNWHKVGDSGTVKITVEPWDDVSASGKASGAGAYKIGKKATIKATAAKGSVFAGWYVKSEDEEGTYYDCLDEYMDVDTDWRNPSFSFEIEDDGEIEIVAQFATAQEDSEPSINIGYWYWETICGDDDCESMQNVKVFQKLDSIRVDEWTSGGTCSPDGGEFRMNALAFVDSVSLPKLTVKGLPPGLKFDSKSGMITGSATKPGVYKVTFSATNATVKKGVSEEIDFIVPNLASDVLPGLKEGTYDYGTVYAGVAFDPGLVDCTAEDGWTVKAAGLPAGLSFKNGEISGVPTKAGTYTVTFTASKKGEANETATITLKVEAMPAWAVGTFTGYAEAIKWQGNTPYSSERGHGFATITVGANGKTSGKVSIGGTNYTFSATGYSGVDSYSDTYWNEDTWTEEYVSFVEACTISGVLKAGKTSIPVTFQIVPFDDLPPCCLEDGGAALVNSCAMEYEDSEDYADGEESLRFWLVRNMWKDKETAASAKKELANWEGVYTLSMGRNGYLSITVGKDGTVKASGKLGDGTAVAAASPLMYDPWYAEGYFAVFYAAPSAYKGGCFWLPVGFGTERGELVDYWGGGEWRNLNPQSTPDYGSNFVEHPEFKGAYYDKTAKLSDYYEELIFKMEEAPHLYYTFKETYVDSETKKKVSMNYIADAYAADTLAQEGCTAGVTSKGFSVLKATKPVQDKSTKEWSYNGSNDGALTLSFAQATGIFKGSYTFWYDYMSAYDDTKPDGKQETVAHTSKKAAFEGIWVQGSESLSGFFPWESMSMYEDPKTNKEKTYKYKEIYGVTLSACGDCSVEEGE